MRRWIAMVLIFALLLPGFAPVATAEGTESTEVVETTEVSEETVAESEAPAETDVSESQMPDGQAEQTVRINFYIFLGTMDGAQPGKHWFFPEDDVMVMSVDVPVGTTVDLNRYVPYCYDYTFRGWYMDPYAAEENNRHEFFEITGDHLEANNHMAENGLYGLHFTAGWTAPEDSGRTMVYFDNTESAWETVACIGVTASGVEHNITIGSRETPDVYYVPLPSEIVKLYFQNASYIFGKTPDKKTEVFDVVAGKTYTYTKSDDFIELEIPTSEICRDPLVCGSVISSNVQNGITPKITGRADEPYYHVQMDFVLPEGFSFSRNSLDREMTYEGDWTDLQDIIEMEPIYPIYIHPTNQIEEYAMTVTITAADGGGNPKTSTQRLVFYIPESSDNVAEPACPNITDAENYTFSLDTIAGSGTTYNQETARLCAMMSDMAYEYDTMEAFLIGELGFSDSVIYSQASNDEVMRCYATKQIIANGEIKNLVYAVFRGEMGGNEWLSDIMVGNTYEYLSFFKAATSVKGELFQYCNDRSFTEENTIFLLTGHGRGAAVANLVGHWLNTGAGLAKKENISVYTFATPTVDRTVITEEAGYSGNENIYNFVYYQDAIRNVPSMQHYGRYGSTIVFGYSMAPFGAEEHSDTYGVYNLSWVGGNFTIPELANAVLYSQDDDLLGYLGGLSKTRFLLELTGVFYQSVLPHQVNAILTKAHGMQNYYKAIVNQPEDTAFEEVNARTEEALTWLSDYATARGLFGKAQLIRKIKSWVTTSAYGLRKNQANNGVDIFVYNAEGEQVASIVDDEVVCTDENLLVHADEEYLYVVYLEKYQENYTIRIESHGDGTIDHCLITAGFEEAESLQLRRDIPVTNGGVLELNGDGLIPVGTESDEDTQAAYSNYTDEEEMEKILQELDNSDAVLGDLDLDGDADAFDLTILARHVGGIEELTDAVALANADVTGDGRINSNDLTKHARFVGGIITSWDQE